MRSAVSVCVTMLTCHEFVLFSIHGLSHTSLFAFALGTGSRVFENICSERVTHASVCFPRGVNVNLKTPEYFPTPFHVFNFYHAINSYQQTNRTSEGVSFTESFRRIWIVPWFCFSLEDGRLFPDFY